MRVLFVSQVFWPDTVSVAQHLWDLAEELASAGHEVHAISSRFPYEQKDIRYASCEIHSGVRIQRLRHTAFGKATTLGRLVDFISFNLISSFKLLGLRAREYDVIVGTTVPPLLSFFAATIARWKSIRFCYWVMDMQPELAIASGMIRAGSLRARFLAMLSDRTCQASHQVIALDAYMRDALVQKGTAMHSLRVIPVWPVMERVYEGTRSENPFRREQGFGERIVVMYSGNHAYVHPLDTLLDAAKLLKADSRFLFVFVGGGVRRKDVEYAKAQHSLDNILLLPYQPRANIHNSLGSSDLQVVILGDGQVGNTHPNKVYGALFIGKPILYIGPSPSHVTDILADLPGNISVKHGQSLAIVEQLQEFAQQTAAEVQSIGERNRSFARQRFAPEALKMEMVRAIEASVALN